MNTSLQALYTESDYAVVSETEGNDCIVSVCNELSDQQKEAISFQGFSRRRQSDFQSGFRQIKPLIM